MGKSFHKFRLSDIEKSARRVGEVGTPICTKRLRSLRSLESLRSLGDFRKFALHSDEGFFPMKESFQDAVVGE